MILFTLYAAIIILDPGHGGDDQGASVTMDGKTILEKDLVLEYTLELSKELSSFGHKVYLTRSLDRYISLDERSEMAQKINPDVFISIHLNSSKFRSAGGFEIYYLDNHNDTTVKRLEEKENQFLGEDANINKILIDLIIDRTSESSKKLAKKVEQSLTNNLKGNYYLKNRGVKPAIFYVLGLTRRPSILIELAFLSNSSDMAKIMNSNMKYRYTKAIASGINNYLK
jgi:N-acetylmuramoyl-L-alanine amidase